MPDEPDAPVIRLVIACDAHAVRAALERLFGADGLGHLARSDRAAAELVLAEVLDNIVEHAQSVLNGAIELAIRMPAQGLACTVVDAGRRMPGDNFPEGRLHDLSSDADDLPRVGSAGI